MKKALLILLLIFPVYTFAQVANDICTNAQAVVIPASGNICLASTNAGATSDGSIHTCDPAPAGNEVWFTYIASGANNTVTVSPTGTSPASSLVVTIHTTNCTSGTYDVCASATGTGTATANTGVVPGTQVWISVETNGTDGGFELCITSLPPAPVPGNTCALASNICDKSNFTISSLANITASGTQPNCFGGAVRKDTWIKFTVGQTGTLEFIGTPLAANEFDWAVYNITNGCLGTLVACNYNYATGAAAGGCGVSGAPFGMLASTAGQPCPAEFNAPITVTAGQTYAIMIDNFANTTNGFSFQWGGTFRIAPTAQFTMNPTTSCSVPVNVTFTNTSVAATSFLWNFGNGNTSTLQNPPAQTYTAQGDYLISLVVTSATGCTNVTSRRLNLNAGPVLTVTPPTATICQGNSVNLAGTIALGTPFNLRNFMESPNIALPNNDPAGVVRTLNSTGMVNPTIGPGTVQSICFTLNHTKHADVGHNDPTGARITVNGNTYNFTPLPLPNVAGTATYCFPAAVINAINAAGGPANTAWLLKVADTRGGGGGTGSLVSWEVILRDNNNVVSWNWSPTTNMTGSNTLTPTVTPSATTTYTLTATDLFGCTSTQNSVITVIASGLSVPNASNNGPVCIGQTINLSTPTVAGATYSWTGPNGFISTLQNPTIANATAANAGVYEVTYSAGGCTSSPGSTTVVITPPDNATFSYTSGTFCQNGSASPTVSTPGGTFTATPMGISINSSTGVINLGLSSAGNYSITYTTAGGCPSSTTEFVTITSAPNAQFSYATPFCQNGPTPPMPSFPTGASAGIFSASPVGMVFVDPNTGAIDLTATAPGSYQVTNTISVSGCPLATHNFTVVVNPIDNAAFNYSAAILCQLGSETPTVVTPGGTFSAAPTGILVNSTTGEINQAGSSGGIYTVTYTTSGSCPSTSSQSIEIAPAPDPQFSYSSPFCQNSPNAFPVLPSSITSGFFSTSVSGLVFVDQNTGEIDFTASSAGTYIVTNSISAPGCPLFTHNFSVQIDPVPTIPLATYNAPVCEGGAIILTATSTTGAGFIWADPNLNPIPGQSPSISGADASLHDGVYSVVAYINNCFSQPGSVNVEVNANPTASVSPVNVQVCPNTPTVLNGSGSGGTSPYIFTWSGNSTPLSSTTTSSPVFNAITPGIYNLTMTLQDDNGCQDVATSQVTVLQPDDATFAYSSAVFCNGSNVLPSSIITPGGSFSASPAGLVINSASGSIDLTNSGIGSYIITYQTAGTCPSSSTFNLSVSQLPAPSAQAPAPYCQGQTIAAITATGLPGTTITWYSDPGLSNQVAIGNSFIPTISSTTTFYFTQSDPIFGCVSPSASVTIVVNPKPAPPAVSSSSPICQGQNLSLTANGGVSGNYTWNGPTGFVSSTQNPTINSATTAHSGTYSATIEVNGCTSDPASVTVVVNAKPSAPNLSNSGPHCIGNRLQLTAASTPGATYSWTGPGGFTSSVQNPFLNNLQDNHFGVYKATVTVNGCSSSPSSTTVSAVNLEAFFSPSSSGGVVPFKVEFKNDSKGAVSYEWNFGNGTNSNVVNPSAEFIKEGSYDVTLIAYTANKQCADTFRVTIVVIGESEVQIPNIFSPNNDGLNEKFTIMGKNILSTTGEIFSRWGHKIFEWDSPTGGWDGKNTFGSDVSDGTYYYIINAKGVDDKEYRFTGTVTLVR
jgi:gliding motility-associated-like protein